VPGLLKGDGRRGEIRLPASVATAVAIALYAGLPVTLILGPRLVIPVLEGLLLLVLVAVNPIRMSRETRWSRMLSLGLIGLIAATNLVALVLLVRQLTQTSSSQSATLLMAAGQVWLTDVIVFALAYWELDRGGPVARVHTRREKLPRADFRFSQDEDHDTVTEVRAGSSVDSNWVPAFPDYLYVSLTNSSAFSPTDTMPLSTRVKMLMGIEATAALVISILVVAKGVGSLGN
jgi:hypothetical protein